MEDPNVAVRIVEVGPRDGLQNIKEPIPTSVKVELVRRLQESGLRTIELTSIVSPRAVPQLSDCRDVLRHPSIQMLHEQSSNRLPVLVPNLKGLDIAIESGVKEVAVFISATEGFSKANIKCSVDEAIERAGQVVYKALCHGLSVRGYVSCIFDDPFDGPTDPSAVLRCVKALLRMGCYEVSLGDTLGLGIPSQVRSLVSYLVKNEVAVERLAGHFHDTYGHAAANAWEAYHCGIRVFDSSVAGLGGCPFAPGAKGNVATEELVFMFHKAGIDTGVNLSRLVKTGTWISHDLNRRRRRQSQPLSLKHDQRPSDPTSVTRWSLQSKKGKLLIYRSGETVKIVLNRAKTGNTVTPKMIQYMKTVIEQCNNDPTTNTIVITGSGRFFCMGVEYGKQPHFSEESTELRDVASLLDLISKSPKTTIACINGPAFGAGVCLALSCQTRISARAATLTMGEANWTSSSSPSVTTRERSTQGATILAHPVTAAKLKSLGILQEVVAGQESLDECLDKTLGLVLSTMQPALGSTDPDGKFQTGPVNGIHRQQDWMQLVSEIWNHNV